jgi:hypothetical protein
VSELPEKLREICRQVNGWGAAIMKPDYDKNLLICIEHFNLPDDWVSLTSPLDDTTLNGTSFTKNRVIIRNHLHQKSVRNAPTQHAVEAIIIVPLIRDTQTIGTIEIIADDINVRFGPEQQIQIEEAVSDFIGLI